MSADERLRAVLAELPQEVTNELAILEDRALRAEGQAAHLRQVNAGLADEVATLRETVEGLQALATELKAHAEQLAADTTADASRIEEHLRRVLIIQARV